MRCTHAVVTARLARPRCDLRASVDFRQAASARGRLAAYCEPLQRLDRQRRDRPPFKRLTEGSTQRGRLRGLRNIYIKGVDNMGFKRVLSVVGRPALLAAGVLLVNSPARAWDDQSHSGAQCQPYSEAAPGSIFHHFTGGLVNNGTGTVNVNCPVQRDDPGSSAGVWAAVYVYNPAGKTTTCTFYSNDINNTVVDSETLSTTWTGNQPLYFTNVTVSSGWGHYFVFCTIPGGGAVQAYYVYEN